MTPTRPLVRYFGGKWRIAPWIVSFFPRHRIYVEPFGGGGSVLLRKPRSYAEIYNDLDGEIVNLFRVVRDHGEELRVAVELTPFSRDEFDGSHEPSDDPVEQARRTLIKCFMGFSSDHNNSKNGFRVYGRNTKITYWENYPDNLRLITDRLRQVVIENLPAIEAMRLYDGPNTLHYVDPPYVHASRNISSHGTYRHEMTDEDHHRLIDALEQLQGAVILSGYHNPIYDERLSGWAYFEKEALADKAGKRLEVLWMRRTISSPELFA